MVSNLLKSVSVAIAASSLTLAGTARAGCSMDNDCKGSRICVDAKCVDPTPAAPAVSSRSEPITSQLSVPPPPQGAPPAATVATVASTADAPRDTFLFGKSWFYSISLLAGMNAIQSGGAGATLFQPVLSANMGTKVTPDFALVGFYSSSLPLVNGQAPLGLGTLGAGLGVGDKYRAMIGGGLTGALPIGGAINDGLSFGGSILAHGSIALTEHVGVHVEATATWVLNATLLQAGIGLGWQG